MLKEDLVKVFEDAFKLNWEKPCFSDYGSDPLTFGEVAFKIKKFHTIFSANGVKKGDKIAICGKNSTNWAIVYLSTLTYGAVTVPLLNDFTAEEIHHLVNHSESKFLFAAENIVEKLDYAQLPQLEVVVKLEDMAIVFSKDESLPGKVAGVMKDFEENQKVTKEDLAFDIPAKTDLASIVYTSGTTGFSKGVMISHNCLMANIRYAIDALPNGGDAMVSFLPLAHCFGCAFDFLLQVVRGLHIVFISKTPTPKILIKAFSEVQPFLVISVPLILEKIYTSKIRPLLETKKMRILMAIPGIRQIIMKKIGKGISDFFGGKCYEVISGGAAFNPKIESFLLKAGVRFTSGYGMTECGPLVAYTDYADGRKIGSCGKIMTYLTAKIDNPDKKGIGEICVKGENIMSGYYKMEKETAEVLDSDGWLHTGDLGRIDKDGFLFICGRLKNMILSASGQNIYPEEIELKVNYMPFVAESLVLDGGEGKLIAFVYPDYDKMKAENVTEEQLAEIMKQNREELNETLPAYAKISEIRIHPEEFQKTSTKKIRRTLYTHLVDKKKGSKKH
ncbi:AMP-binding protein [bacterium]|nr:AMP-binding protein [bacterium]